MKTFIELISDKMKAAFAECGYEERFGQVAVSNRPDLCQYQCNGALAAAKQYHKAPIMIAQEVSARLKDDSFFVKAEAVNPGFLNLIVSDSALSDHIDRMRTSEYFGFEPANAGKTAIVDYGGANVAKPLHVGHLRPAIIGESVKRILAFDGYKTIGDVHLGDWGLPIGLIITEFRARKPDLIYFDDSYTGEYPSEAPFTISDLEEIYPYASAYSKEHPEYRDAAREATAELQNGSKPGYRALWKHILEVSKNDLRKNYDNLNVHFELWNGESDAYCDIAPMVEDMKARGVCHLSEGALVIDVKEESDTKEMPPCILIKSDGAAIYASTDLATLVQRERLYHPDKVVYVVDKRQGLHFEQVFRAAKKSGIVRPETSLYFLGNGTMNGKDGTPFKTRDGGVMRLEFLIRDIASKVAEKMEDRELSDIEKSQISRIVGLAALKYGDLSNQATKDYVFDIDRFTSFEGNTGPYILYTMVRIKSILDKYVQTVGMTREELEKAYSAGALRFTGSELSCSESETKLMLGITDFADAIRHAADDIAPHKICSYIFELADLFNTFYHENRIIAEESADVQKRWISLSMLTLKLLETCTDMIAVDVPDRM